MGIRNFVEAMGDLGYTYDYEYNQGNRDVIVYAQAALSNFDTFGDRAATDIQETQGVIAMIEQAMTGS